MTSGVDLQVQHMLRVLLTRAKHHPRPVISRLLALAFVAGATLAHAQVGANLDASAGPVSDTPWVPDVLVFVDPYVPDPKFGLSLDHFADSNSLDQEGSLTAQLANGNILTAGLVPDGVGGGSCGDGTRLCSIGLVRYNQSGQRVAWPNAGANGRFTNNYLVYPGANPGFNHYQYLRDLKVRGNYIDVLVDEPDVNHPALTLGHRNVRVVTFRDDGSFVGQFGIFGVAPNGGVESEDFYGAQMVQMNSTTMMVAATVYDSVGPYIALTRLDILANGALSPDLNWGAPYLGSLSFNSLIRYFAPNSYCGGGGFDCDVTANYVAKQVGFPVQTDLYIAGSIHIGGSNWDAIALKVSSVDGSVKTEFNSSGWSRAVFDDAGSTLDDRAAGLYVFQDDVYMAAQVSRKCSNGIGVAKLDGATGANNTAFGTGGKIVFGGQGNSPICILGGDIDVPFTIAATGGRIGIAGYKGYKPPLSGYRVDPMLAVVNAASGQVISFDNYPVTRTDGSRAGDAILFGIYGGNLPTSPFTVAGYGRDANAGNTLSYVTGKLIPVSSDRIFANNFGNGDDL